MRFLLPTVLALTACDIPPANVDTFTIDDAMARGKIRTVCKGLEMKEDRVRKYAADRLKTLDDPAAAECVCEHIEHPYKGWDASIVEGLKGTDKDAFAGCFAELVKKPDLPRRTEAVVALTTMPAPIARATLAEIAQDTSSDGEARKHAIKTIGHDIAYKDTLLGLLEDDKDPIVRAAACQGLNTFDDPAVTKAIRGAYEGDADGAVRGEALIALKKMKVDDADDLLCKAMMDDSDAEVRKRAVLAYKGTKRAEPLKCLRKRALTEELDPGVREDLLTVLKSSPSDDAAKILCDAIPFWMAHYVTTDIPDKLPGTGIIRAQNDRDWERSYSCLEKAYRHTSGYSCYAKMTVAWWFREYGGQSYVPNCPGYENKKIQK